ncbi:MAG: hypothetical protein V3V22_05420 [Methylococcales bacterium]
MGNANKVEMTAQDRAGAVDKIRDLLFGSQMENYDQHFHHLETMIVNASKTSSELMSTRLMALEISLNQRIEKTEQTLERERKERIAALDAVNVTLQQNFLQLNDQLQKVEGGTTQTIADVKILLDQQTQGLSSQIQTLREQFNQSLNDHATQLDAQINKRQKLADLLSKVSKQLMHD